MPIRWVFFDIGDVIFDEDAPHKIYFHSLLLAMRRNGVDVAWDDYYQRILECARERPSSAPQDAARAWVLDDALWDKIYSEGRSEYDAIRKPRPYGVLLDDMAPVLFDLHRDFKLGVIANQHPPVMQALHDYGIGQLFGVIGIDQIVGLSKPDPAFFQWAFDQAGCAAQEAMMVGDRADVDVAPARRLGLVTIRFRRGLLYTHYDPREPDERADLEISDVAHLAGAVRQLAAERK